MAKEPAPRLDVEATQRHVADVARLLAGDREVRDVRAVVRRLGGHGVGSRGVFGFWVPALAQGPADVSLEILLPPASIDLTATEPQAVEFVRVVVPMATIDEFAWAVVAGLAPGTRAECGPLYRALVDPADGDAHRLIDPLAHSTPFGAFAPSELIDSEDLFALRNDDAYYADLTRDAGGGESAPRLGPFVNMLEVHVATATDEGTLAGLAAVIAEVGRKITAGEPLTPADELWLGYDALQLMPVEPTIRRERGPFSWEEVDADDGALRTRVARPATTNWGYDVVIGGSAAVNPALLSTGRPHELSDLAAALHNFPTGPIHLVLDVVYGHADHQALEVLPDAWFTGPDMYGQHLDYRNPIVRAHLLEMQRRKANHGADGVRVDGAQDFTWWDAEREVVVHDDDFLVEMSEVVQEVGGTRYRPWMIFEDGRPWPRPDWELASTYRAVTDRQPHAFQWGPLTFAHNTPFLFTFWITKWWRLREIAEVGDNWISGCANHDTLRRGSQVDPDARINSYLGDDMPTVIGRAYDHPAATLLFHAFLPGVPMDFLQGIARAPWSFVRNTDHRYAIKVWAEEARFLDWRVPRAAYDDPEAFPRMKSLGFRDVDSLEAFMESLLAAVTIHKDAVEPVVAAAQVMPRPEGLPATAQALNEASHLWMDDVHDFCRVGRHLDDLDPALVAFDRAARTFRLEHPWLRGRLSADDTFAHVHPANGSVIFHGIRRGPDGERVLFAANMEGAPREVAPLELAGAPARGWRPALVSPGVGTADASRPIVLTDGEGVVFVSERDRA